MTLKMVKMTLSEGQNLYQKFWFLEGICPEIYPSPREIFEISRGQREIFENFPEGAQRTREIFENFPLPEGHLKIDQGQG